MSRPDTRRRLAYVGVTALLAVGGGTVAARVAGWSAGDVALGLGAAWTVQAVSFWKLTGKLWTGARALRPWAAGIAARVAGLLVLWVAGAAAGRPGPDLVGTYALALVVFLVLEAAWLATPAPPRGRPARNGRET